VKAQKGREGTKTKPNPHGNSIAETKVIKTEDCAVAWGGGSGGIAEKSLRELRSLVNKWNTEE